MKQQGRQAGANAGKQRPEPLVTMSEQAQAEWRRVVDALPVDWFGPETWALLEAYCNSVAQMRWLEAEAAKLQDDVPKNGLDLQLYAYYRKQSAAEATLMANLATKLRITLQASASKDKSKDKGSKGGPKPWESLDDK